VSDARKVPLARVGVPSKCADPWMARRPWAQEWRKPDGKSVRTYYATEAEAKRAREFA
jgi:hypothetical protein